MKYIRLPWTDDVRRLSFYLAMEEYVARHIDEPDSFFMWQVEPSVIFGRNQLMETEVNLNFCQKHNHGCRPAVPGILRVLAQIPENMNIAFRVTLSKMI